MEESKNTKESFTESTDSIENTANNQFVHESANIEGETLEPLSISSSLAELSLQKISDCQEERNTEGVVSPMDSEKVSARQLFATESEEFLEADANEKTQPPTGKSLTDLSHLELISQFTPGVPEPPAEPTLPLTPLESGVVASSMMAATHVTEVECEAVESEDSGVNSIQNEEAVEGTSETQSQQEEGSNHALFMKRQSEGKIDLEACTEIEDGKLKAQEKDMALEDVTERESQLDSELHVRKEEVDVDLSTPTTRPATADQPKEKVSSASKSRQPATNKKKEGVKKMKTAPAKLANMVAAKATVQQKGISSGVAKRLVKGQTSQPDLTYGKADITNKSEDLKAFTQMTNQKSLSSVVANGTTMRALKTKEKKAPPSKDLGNKTPSKTSIDKVLAKAKKSGGSTASTTKWKKGGLEKATEASQAKQTKGKSENQKLLIADELAANEDPETVQKSASSEALPDQSNSENINLDLPEEPLRDRKYSTVSTDTSLAVSMQQAKQETKSEPKEKSVEVLPVKLMPNDGSLLKSLIPYLPLPLAVTFLVLNILLPGVGTILSGFSVLCCGRPRAEGKDDQISQTVVVNLFVGIAQMVTVTFMLVGWFWSIFWGIYMVVLAKSQNGEREGEDAAGSLTVLI